MNYIVSKFTKDFISQSGECFLYNSRSNSLLKVSKAIHELINKVISGEVDLIKSLPNDVFDYLRKHKILVADSEDHEYILNLELNHNLRMFDRERMILVIAPTTSCNFECDYCFEENKQNKFMQDSTITELIDFIKKFELIKTIHLTWYGGEPLLATKIINKILQKFQNELKNITLNYHLLITNGFYLTKDKISFFKDFPLDEIQVTFDGEKERHNLKRYIKGSTDGSYDTIVSNLDWFCSEFEDTRVSVRINIDKNNVHEFVRLRRELLNRWKDKNVSVYPGILRIEDDTKKCMGCEALLHDDIRELFYSLEEVNFFPEIKNKGCFATHINSYVIGPEGEMYKCWNDVSDKNKVFGNIRDKKISNSFLFNQYVVSASPFNDEKCKKCYYLPICVGGCAWYKLKNIYEEGEYNICSLYNSEGVLERCLEIHIDKIKNGK